MRFGEFARIERDISTAENGTIWHRWRYGRRLLCNNETTTPAGNFKHGVLEKLIRASGGKLSERELQRRLQCGRTYPKESQIRRVATDFKTWRDLYQAGFPPYEGEEDELPYNPLDTEELVKQHDTEAKRQDEDDRYEGGGLVPRSEYAEDFALIPRDTFAPTVTLRELKRWAEEEVELAARHGERAHKRLRYIISLIKEMGDDLDATLETAERKFHGRDH